MSIQTQTYHRDWRAKNPDKWRAYSKEYYQKNREKIRKMRDTEEYRARLSLYLRDWRAKNVAKRKLDMQEWQENNRSKVKNFRTAYAPRRRKLYQERRDVICKRKRELYPRYRSRIRAYVRLRRKQNIQFAIADSLRATMNRALRRQFTKKSARTFELVGCSPTDLRAHLESLFLPGMSWGNRHLWHVDHRKALATFDLTKIDQQRAAFHFSNLQPLWATDNIRKGKN